MTAPKDAELAVAEDFLRCIPPNLFVGAVQALVERRGVGFDAGTCLFPESLDPGEAPFEGVRISTLNEEVTVDLAAFHRLLRAAVASFLAHHPEDQAALSGALGRLDARR